MSSRYFNTSHTRRHGFGEKLPWIMVYKMIDTSWLCLTLILTKLRSYWLHLWPQSILLPLHESPQFTVSVLFSPLIKFCPKKNVPINRWLFSCQVRMRIVYSVKQCCYPTKFKWENAQHDNMCFRENVII